MLAIIEQEPQQAAQLAALKVNMLAGPSLRALKEE